jgi:hypothetical protein
METPRPLNKIAAEILTLWSSVVLGKNKAPPAYVIHSMPYVQAMLQMSKVGDMYGLEYGDMIVAYFLSNAAPWRGVEAARIKAELNQLLKEYNREHHSSAQR